ncbi:MAG: NAD(P)H-binding protein, partial [Mycetocola sp.]
MSAKRILVTGSTGYVGGRLVPRLLAAGHDVRVLVRTPEKLLDVPWAGQVEIVQGTLQDRDAMARACEGIDVLYYLVHSMTGRGDFELEERNAAESVASAARNAGVARIVYLGGLHPDSPDLSRHLRS